MSRPDRFGGSGGARASDRTEINISPMIDLVFILLIFFIVTTVFVDEVGIGVQKPQPSAAEALDRDPVVFRLARDGRVLHAGAEIGIAGVRVTLRAQPREGAPVVFVVENQAPAGLMVQAMDAAREAGAENISLRPAG